MNWVLWCAEEMSTFCKTEVSTVSCSSSGLIFILSNVLRDRTRLDHLVNFPINFNHEWWELALPLGDDRSQSHYATKNQYSSKIYESFYLEPRAKNIDDHAGRVLLLLLTRLDHVATWSNQFDESDEICPQAPKKSARCII